MLVAAAGSSNECGLGRRGWVDMVPQTTFDESEIRDAERRLEAALEAADPTAWVFD